MTILHYEVLRLLRKKEMTIHQLAEKMMSKPAVVLRKLQIPHHRDFYFFQGVANGLNQPITWVEARHLADMHSCGVLTEALHLRAEAQMFSTT